jgi:hypothetical protein
VPRCPGGTQTFVGELVEQLSMRYLRPSGWILDEVGSDMIALLRPQPKGCI